MDIVVPNNGYAIIVSGALDKLGRTDLFPQNEKVQMPKSICYWAWSSMETLQTARGLYTTTLYYQKQLMVDATVTEFLL